jgi:6-phosphogluconolactonase/glucosamine-6-phosphate isomerase/deaminase
VEIKYYETPELALSSAVAELKRVLEETVRQGQDVLLLLSGGSNLKVLEKIDKELLNHPKMTKYVLDERFSTDPKENNSKQIDALGIQVQPTVPGDGETLEAFASRFDGELKKWKTEHPQGKTVATLGMGPDGHIAGIGPKPEDEVGFAETFYNTDKLVVGYIGSLTPPQRVTVTPKFLKSYVDEMIGLILGEGKREAFEAFKNKSTKANMHPAQILHEAQGQVTIMTDIKE